MTILSWDKPAQVVSKEEWASNQADSAPPGTYVPNMSEEDVRRWKAKRVGFKAGHPQIEIRKDTTVIVVSLHGGYKYRHYGRTTGSWPGPSTEGINLHIATAGPIQWTWQEWTECQEAIAEAKAVLEKETT